VSTPESPTYALGAATLAATQYPPPLGRDWSEAFPYVYPKSELSSQDSCMDDAVAPIGASQTDFAYNLSPEGTESGHVAFTVWVLPSASDAKKRMELRADPRYVACVTEQDTADTASGRGTDIENLSTSRFDPNVPFPAVAYRNEHRFSFAGESKIEYSDRAYVRAGRFVGLFLTRSCCDRFSDTFFEHQLTAFKERIDALDAAEH
jgi:hypothetical protein